MQVSNIEKSILREGRIWVIRINRQNKRNCVNSSTAIELLSTFQQFETNKTAEIAIFASKEGVFCAGFDLQEASTFSAKSIGKWDPSEIVNTTAPMGVSRIVLTKPVIAAVEGFAVAGGLELALWCDLIVSHKSAIFGVHCRRFGVPLIDGGTVRLPQVVGINRARDMVLTGREVSGEEAHNWGLVNRLCVEKEQVFETAMQLCEDIIVHPQLCMRLDRLNLAESVYGNIQNSLANEFHRGSIALTNGKSASGASKFINQKQGRSGKLLPKL